MTLFTLLSSTNIDQSEPNLVKMYVIVRSQMTSIMDLMEPELSELSALELEDLPYLTVYTLAFANIDQSVPKLDTVLHPELFALEFGKIAETDFVYSLAFPNINQSAPNLVTIFMTMRSWIGSIMGQIQL